MHCSPTWADHDCMQARWPEGIFTMVNQVTCGAWRKKKNIARPVDDPAPKRRRVKSSERPEFFTGKTKAGQEVKVCFKMNSPKGKRVQKLVVVMVGPTQLVQVDTIYFPSETDAVAWGNKVAKMSTERELLKPAAETMKREHHDQEISKKLYAERIKDPVWNRGLVKEAPPAPVQPDAEQPRTPAQTPVAEPPIEAPPAPQRTASSTSTATTSMAAPPTPPEVAPPPSPETCSQLDKAEAQMGSIAGGEAPRTPTPARRAPSPSNDAAVAAPATVAAPVTVEASPPPQPSMAPPPARSVLDTP
jgi:hypothetical protein